MVLLVSLCGEAAASNLFYLGIGCDYKSTGKQDDPYAPDIVKIDSILRNNYTTFYNGYQSNLILGAKASRKLVMDGFQWLEQSEEDDLVIIHIDAHGWISKKGYVFCPNDDIYGYEIKDALSQVKAKIFLILDTCHSGALVKDWGVYNRNIIIITACDSHEASHATHFLNALLDALDKADYNRDGFVTISELAFYVKRRIKYYTNVQTVIVSKAPFNYYLKATA